MTKLRDREKGEQSLGGGGGGASSPPRAAIFAAGDAAGAPGPRREQGWTETFLGGSPDQEQREFRAFARTIRRVQARTRGDAKALLRGLHAKMLAGTRDATLTVNSDRGGYFREGASYAVTLRLSSASSRPQPDGKGDLRGIALRVHTPEGGCDLLMTNAEVSHVRDAAEFMAFTSAMSRGRALGVLILLATRPRRGFQMVKAALSQVRHAPRSLAAETFWSRAPFLLQGRPVRYQLRPEAPATLEACGENQLFDDLKLKLAREPLRFVLWAQPYADEQQTPLEDASKPWSTAPQRVATLTLEQQTLPDPSSSTWREIDALRFDPWNTRNDMRPLGSMNRARRYVYKASQEERSRPLPSTPSLFTEVALPLIERSFRLLNRARRWDRFGPRLGTLNLIGLRETFRRENLFSADDPGAARPLPPTPVPAPRARLSSGAFNDSIRPEVGAVGARFGRNVPFAALKQETTAQLRTPDPCEVSERLLKRTTFVPAPTLNLLAVAWIQFQVHDWFKHRERTGDHAPANAREQLARELGVNPTLVSKQGTELDQAVVPAHENEVTHWWDCSQIYGNDDAKAAALREGKEGARDATLRLDAGLLPLDDGGYPITGNKQNWWIGLEIMHTLFAREHNAICHALRAEYGAWPEQRIYEVARLVNVATMAKIHTVEWTPALLGHPTLRRAMEAHWNGLFGKRWQKSSPPTSELRNGIPGSPSDHFDVPFALTEEFVSVYRLHPMLPDVIALRVPDAPQQATISLPFKAVAFRAAPQLAREPGIGALTYSLGLACPGQMCLHNYPEFLRKLPKEDGRSRDDVDLAAVDVFRDRERNVPRYNAFRKQFGLKRVESFHELAVDEATRDALIEIYKRVDNIDLLVGLLSETPPAGFAISDTAFRVFVGMASRRLKSDRFITDDFREELYTKVGLAWVRDATFKTVLQRHLPELHTTLTGVRDVFAPWA
jgi:Animal haem peroxidase/Catalase